MTSVNISVHIFHMCISGELGHRINTSATFPIMPEQMPAVLHSCKKKKIHFFFIANIIGIKCGDFNLITLMANEDEYLFLSILVT